VPKGIAVIGAGGHAREVRWLIECVNRAGQGDYRFLGYIVADLSRVDPHDCADEILGDDAWLEAHATEVDALTMGVGSPAARLRIAHRLEETMPQVEWPALVHPSVVLEAGSATIGRGAQLCAGVVGTVNVVVEPFALANFGSRLGHEARIGRGAVVNPGAGLSGGVTLGEGALIGAGAQVLQYLTVGAGARVGAGAVVTRHVPPGVTVVGVPARPVERG
jgi:sugar O-acyltransferase (sialic acid O-acetyltransferase NeuD family)